MPTLILLVIPESREPLKHLGATKKRANFYFTHDASFPDTFFEKAIAQYIEPTIVKAPAIAINALLNFRNRRSGDFRPRIRAAKTSQAKFPTPARNWMEDRFVAIGTH
tara:strand:- start:2456 stop:2779 length:324 start_codon:yes stop_codon:yes gene_type:complete